MSSESQTIEGVELRPIPGTGGRYSISRDGRVRSHAREVPCENGTGKKSTRLVKGHWIKTKTKDGITKATLSVAGESRYLNVEKTVADVWVMTRRELSLLLFFECAVVDVAGAVDSRRMNRDDFEIAERWNAEGFVRFGRVNSRDLNQKTREGFHRTHWVELTERAWQAAHLERRARAERVAERRTWQRNCPKIANCRFDTDGDGDCPLCHKLPGGCEEYRSNFLRKGVAS